MTEEVKTQEQKIESKWCGVFCTHKFIQKKQISNGSWLCELPSGKKFFLPNGAFVSDKTTGADKVISLKTSFIKVFRDEYNEEYRAFQKIEEFKIPALQLMGIIKTELMAMEQEDIITLEQELENDSNYVPEIADEINVDEELKNG